MTFRQRPPNRRPLETIAIELEGQRYKISLGREYLCDGSCGGQERFGRIVEIFINAQKVNSPIDVLVGDAGVLLSMLIQYGCPIDDIFHAMKRYPDGSPASPLGRAAAYLLEGDQ
jgi:hypothetical protein